MPSRPAAARPAAPPPKTLSPVAIGLGAVGAVLLLIGMVWGFGAGHSLFVPEAAPVRPTASAPAAKIEPTGPPPTNIYRSTRDGRVLVMEVDQNGTRIKGTMSRRDVPIDADEYRDGPINGNGGPGSAENRVQAMGNVFR